MADDMKSKLDEFRERLAGTAGRVARNPLIQGGVGLQYGPLASLALKAAGDTKALGATTQEQPFAAGGPAFAPKVTRPPEVVDLNAAQAQNPAPYPYNQGAQAMPGVEALKAPELPRGGGVGNGVNPLTGLKANLQSAQLATMEGLDQDTELQRDLGDTRAVQRERHAGLLDEQAARMDIDARNQMQADKEAHDNQVAFLRRNEQLADDIGQQRIDPNRLMKSKGAIEKTTFLMGSILGGALAGLRGGRNETLDRLDAEIQQDIDTQAKNIETKKSSLSARQTLFGQMLQETGDSRIAAMQSRNLLLESFKQKVLAEGERSAIPEVKVNAEIAARGIQAKQDALREQTAAQNYSSELQRQQAAANERAAAERAAWERAKWVAEYGLKNRELDIKENEKKNEKGDKTDAQVAELSKRLSDKDLADGRNAVENLKGQLAAAPQNEGIPGVGLGADIRRNLVKGATFGLASDSFADRVALSDQERVNRGDWDKLKLSYQKQITGSGASNEERAMISKAFEGAKTPAEQRAAIATADALYQQIEQRNLAGFSPEVVSTFKQRLAAQGKK